MEKFQIIIKNLETGETLVDTNTCAIIGAIDRGRGTQIVCSTACGTVELAATCAGALQAANRGMECLPRDIVNQIKKLAKKI